MAAWRSSRAAAREAEELRGLDDEKLLRLVRGTASVDRAVRRHRDRGLWEPRIPTAVAVAIGWPLCARCGHPIVPWQRVGWRGGDWHPSCISEVLSERSPDHNARP